MKLTQGQSDIFKLIYEPDYTRVVVRAVTQYGKSDTTSMAIIMAAVNRREKVLIVAPSEQQASIIMGDVIDHLFDHPYITQMMSYDRGSLERLKQERSKNRITLRNGSEIFVLTANVREVKREATNLMGFGASIVIIDESSLIPDTMFSKILRMVGGFKRGKIVQLGNPFERNHFYKAFYSDRYEKIIIDDKQALAEGRISQEMLDEAREEMSPLEYKIFYECEFPEGGSIDSLIPLDWINLAVNNSRVKPSGAKGAGLDVARFGNDKSILVKRTGNYVHPLLENRKLDTMTLVGWAREHLDDEEDLDSLNIDAVGVGAGVYDRMDELADNGDIDYEVFEISGGSSAIGEYGGKPAKDKFVNLRAQIHWQLRDVFKPNDDGTSNVHIPDDAELKKQLSEIRYKFASDKRIKIEEKEEMKKRIGMSPDKADALGYCFFVPGEEIDEDDMIIMG